MTRFFLYVALFCASSGLAHGQAPDALTIQLAMNDGLELEYQYFQELANVQIVRGGTTEEGEYLFVCTAQLVWKLSCTEFETIMQQEIEEEVALRGGDEELWRALLIVLAGKLQRIGEFASGDTVSNVHFRVRLEQAGTDWIVTDTKVRESEHNPLDIIDKRTP